MSVAPELVTIAGCITAGIVDARTGYIPDAASIGTAIAAFACAAFEGTSSSAVAGALTAGTALAAVYGATRGTGLGLGDVKLGVAIGMGFGPLGGIIAVATSFVAGGAYGAFLLVSARARCGDSVRFGPFLAAGSVLTALAFANTGSFVAHAARYLTAP